MEKRDPFFYGNIIEQVADGVVVHGIHDTTGVSHKICGIHCVNSHIYGVDRDIRVDVF